VPGHICEPVKRGVRRLVLAPLKIPKTFYQRVVERRQLTEDIRKAQAQISSDTSADLEDFHQALWGEGWTEAVSRIQEARRRREISNE